jgi:DNA-binding PadR family transcriptional regulator
VDAPATAARPTLSLTEWIVLSLVAERPAHGFALARDLRPGAELGRVWTVSRSLVYRALERLDRLGLVRPAAEEPGEGPTRIIREATPAGREAAAVWRREPVEHLRDVRSAFLVKVLLTRRAGEAEQELVAAQRARFDPLFRALAAEAEDGSVVGAWRLEFSRAVARLLDRLATAC